MTRPQDAAMLAALERQHRDLSIVLARLERARRDLIPPPATFWRGTARHAYDAALDGLARTVDAGVAAVRASRDHTQAAIARIVSHAG